MWPEDVNQDEKHLKLLSIFHYVVGGLVAMLACIPILHLIMGIFMLNAPKEAWGSNPPPAWFGLFLL